jgi:formylglycine-generating enzyme required for sulfatase activity
MRRHLWLLVAVLLASAGSPAWAGPWGALPDAVARLQVDPGDRGAERVVGEAEASIMVEARNGRLAAVATLMEVYASLVMRLPDGDGRVRRVEERVAGILTTFGQGRQEGEVAAAAAAWTMAANLDRSGAAVGLLRQILLPPPEPEGGDIWTSPLDGTELVYHPASRVRVGCSEIDRRCRDNEVYFRWVEVPGFWIEAREVSNDRYRRCVDSGACSPPLDPFRFNESSRGSEPVVGISWRQARDYSRWTGRRLPSEAEWERAARAAEMRWRFPWGNNRAADRANTWDEMRPAGSGPTAVGSFPATGLGIFDIAGNVWEWCEDRYQTSFKDLPADGSPMTSGIGRVVRGGSWRRDIDLARVSTRSWYDEGYRADDVGFRCAMDASTEISDGKVVAMASRAYPTTARPGQELVGAELTSEDRRYLVRRAITWLVLEERPQEAVLQAESLLRTDPRDPVALDLLDWVEDELTKAARAGNVSAVAELRFSFQRAVSGDPRFERRLQAMEVRLLEALKACGESFSRNGDFRQASACIEEGLKIASSDPALRRALASLERTPGELRTWPADGKVMAWVPSGSFRYGASEGDRQAATDELPSAEFIVTGFWIDRTEVTNAEYRRCVDAGACTPPSRTEAYDDPNRSSNPVIWVSWFQARDYAEWAGKRLPTEVEWERAARGGSDSRYPWGDRWSPSMANGMGTADSDYWAAEAPVGSFPANKWGIHDLIGNVAEYVQDVYHISYNGAPRDGRAWEQETGHAAERRRVARNGSYADPSSRLRVSRRNARRPDDPNRATGFRCAVD